MFHVEHFVDRYVRTEMDIKRPQIEQGERVNVGRMMFGPREPALKRLFH